MGERPDRDGNAHHRLAALVSIAANSIVQKARSQEVLFVK